jgi:hypothetical protein
MEILFWLGVSDKSIPKCLNFVQSETNAMISY